MIPKIVKKAEETIEPRVVVLGGVQKAAKSPLKTSNPRNTKDISIRTLKAVEEVVKGGKSKAEALRSAGFSDAVANNPKKVFDRPAVKDLLDPVVSKMIKERDAVLKLMSKKRVAANYATLGMILRNLNHDIELLRGGVTDRTDVELSDEHKKYLEDLINRNK